MKLCWPVRGMFYTYPSELYFSSSKNAGLVQPNFVSGQSSIAFPIVSWMMNSVHGEREEAKQGNDEAVLKINAFGEKNNVYYWKFHHQNYIAGIFHNNYWYAEKLKNVETYQCNPGLVKVFYIASKWQLPFCFYVWMGTTSYSQGILEK